MEISQIKSNWITVRILFGTVTVARMSLSQISARTIPSNFIWHYQLVCIGQFRLNKGCCWFICSIGRKKTAIVHGSFFCEIFSWVLSTYKSLEFFGWNVVTIFKFKCISVYASIWSIHMFGFWIWSKQLVVRDSSILLHPYWHKKRCSDSSKKKRKAWVGAEP